MADHANTAALILAGAPSDEKYDSEMALHQCMEDLARAVHQTPPDLRGMMSAFRSAFQCLEAEPHDEAEEGG